MKTETTAIEAAQILAALADFLRDAGLVGAARIVSSLSMQPSGALADAQVAHLAALTLEERHLLVGALCMALNEIKRGPYQFQPDTVPAFERLAGAVCIAALQIDMATGPRMLSRMPADFAPATATAH